MNMLQPVFSVIRHQSKSLFLRLIAGFLCIILLLVSLTLYSISVSKMNVRKEIVEYNTLLLNNTMEGYEKHIEMINKQMHLYLYSQGIQRLQYSPQIINYPTLQREIQTWVSNSYLFIENVVLYTKRDDFILEKGTSTVAETMFSVFNNSEQYPVEFWRQQFNEDYSSRMLPSAVFYNDSYGKRESNGELIPIIYKARGDSDLMIVVFLKAAQMFETFHLAPSDDFIMYDDQGQTLFQSVGKDPFISLSQLREYDGKELILDGKYHFYTTGTLSGNTYIHRVPVEKIASQTRLNITLVAILVLSITLSVVAALLIAARINSPLQQMIRSNHEGRPLRSSIREFDLISHQLYDKKKSDQQIALFNLLKAIRNNEHTVATLEFTDKHFVFILFHVVSKQDYTREHVSFQKWLYYMKVFIENELNRAFPDPLTFQIEQNQILSLVFTDNMSIMQDLLGRLKGIFEQDKEYGNMTIAVTRVYSHTNQIADAYQEAQSMLGERKLVDTVQIITTRQAKQQAITFSTDQEKEFSVNLREGNVEELEAFMSRFFAKWHKDEPAASTLIHFAGTLIGKIKMEVSYLLIRDEGLQAMLEHTHEKIQQCITLSELELLLQDGVTFAAKVVREKKEQSGQKDPITLFVMDFVNERYAEDLYLDKLAEQLNLSSGYLSSYFKEKTGMNIVDYINETRIVKATYLLENKRLKIHDVAEAVGYRNVSSFNRTFKKYTGVTPSDFRKKPDMRY